MNIQVVSENHFAKITSNYVAGRYKEAIVCAEEAYRFIRNNFDVSHQNVVSIMLTLAELYRTVGRYQDAEVIYVEAVSKVERLYGKDHPEVANLFNSVALLFFFQGKYFEAEMFFKRELAIWQKHEKQEGKVALALNNLAELYRVQGKHKLAEPLYNRSLLKWEQQIQKDKVEHKKPMLQKILSAVGEANDTGHAEVARSLKNLSMNFCAQGKFLEAEDHAKHALEKMEKALGKNHLDTIPFIYNLIEVYENLGKFHETEVLHKLVIETYEKANKKNAIDMANAQFSLAKLYYNQGSYEQAAKYCSEALRIKKIDLLSEKNLEIPQLKIFLGDTIFSMGFYDEAEKLYTEAQNTIKILDGFDSVLLAEPLQKIASVLFLSGRFIDAEKSLAEAVSILEPALGHTHEDVINAINKKIRLHIINKKFDEALEIANYLAELLNQNSLPASVTSFTTIVISEAYRGSNQFDKTELFLGKAYDDFKFKNAASHNIAVCLNNLASLYHGQEQFLAASPLYEEALKIWENHFGTASTNIGAFLNTYTAFCRMKNDPQEAEQMQQRVILIWEEILGKDNPGVVPYLLILASVFTALNKFTEAEALYKRAYSSWEKVLGAQNLNMTVILKGQAALYTKMGKTGQAASVEQAAKVIEMQYESYIGNAA